MIPASWYPVANHLWQSTLFAGAAMLLALALRRNRAQLRYGIWLAASIKFLVPFSLLVSTGSLFEWRSAPAVPAPLASTVEQVSRPFAEPVMEMVTAQGPPALMRTTSLLAAVWLCGFAVVLTLWAIRWMRISAAVSAASPLQIPAPVRVMSSPTAMEPGVFGIFRPILLLPDGIAERLSPAQLNAILAHELCHVRRRDNLAAAVHMIVEALFWFHPLVWWIGARLIEERERACDEEVLRLGNEPQEYAAGILNVCKFYLESPLACASGVTGADLKKRIEAIMLDRISHKLTLTRKLLLAAAGMMAVAGPVLIGMLSVPRGRAQSKPENLTFEVASIKPANPDARGVRIMMQPGGGFRGENVRLRQLIEFAYEVQPYQVSGGPNWIGSEGFDINAKAPASDLTEADIRKMTDAQRKEMQDQARQRMRALLAERFQLVIKRDQKELPIYALVIGKNGHKLKEAEGGGGEVRQMLSGRPGDLTAENVPLALLATNIGRALGRPVVDKTGLTGRYSFKLEWTPDQPAGGPGGLAAQKAEGAAGPASVDPSGPSLTTALQEQLGLRLESQKAPVETIIIERAEKPTEN